MPRKLLVNRNLDREKKKKKKNSRRISALSKYLNQQIPRIINR